MFMNYGGGRRGGGGNYNDWERGGDSPPGKTSRSESPIMGAIGLTEKPLFVSRMQRRRLLDDRGSGSGGSEEENGAEFDGRNSQTSDRSRSRASMDNYSDSAPLRYSHDNPQEQYGQSRTRLNDSYQRPTVEDYHQHQADELVDFQLSSPLASSTPRPQGKYTGWGAGPGTWEGDDSLQFNPISEPNNRNYDENAFQSSPPQIQSYEAERPNSGNSSTGSSNAGLNTGRTTRRRIRQPLEPIREDAGGRNSGRNSRMSGGLRSPEARAQPRRSSTGRRQVEETDQERRDRIRSTIDSGVSGSIASNSRSLGRNSLGSGRTENASSFHTKESPRRKDGDVFNTSGLPVPQPRPKSNYFRDYKNRGQLVTDAEEEAANHPAVSDRPETPPPPSPNLDDLEDSPTPRRRSAVANSSNRSFQASNNTPSPLRRLGASSAATASLMRSPHIGADEESTADITKEVQIPGTPAVYVRPSRKNRESYRENSKSPEEIAKDENALREALRAFSRVNSPSGDAARDKGGSGAGNVGASAKDRVTTLRGEGKDKDPSFDVAGMGRMAATAASSFEARYELAEKLNSVGTNRKQRGDVNNTSTSSTSRSTTLATSASASQTQSDKPTESTANNSRWNSISSFFSRQKPSTTKNLETTSSNDENTNANRPHSQPSSSSAISTSSSSMASNRTGTVPKTSGRSSTVPRPSTPESRRQKAHLYQDSQMPPSPSLSDFGVDDNDTNILMPPARQTANTTALDKGKGREVLVSTDTNTTRPSLKARTSDPSSADSTKEFLRDLYKDDDNIDLSLLGQDPKSEVSPTDSEYDVSAFLRTPTKRRENPQDEKETAEIVANPKFQAKVKEAERNILSTLNNRLQTLQLELRATSKGISVLENTLEKQEEAEARNQGTAGPSSSSASTSTHSQGSGLSLPTTAAKAVEALTTQRRNKTARNSSGNNLRNRHHTSSNSPWRYVSACSIYTLIILGTMLFALGLELIFFLYSVTQVPCRKEHEFFDGMCQLRYMPMGYVHPTPIFEEEPLPLGSYFLGAVRHVLRGFKRGGLAWGVAFIAALLQWIVFAAWALVRGTVIGIWDGVAFVFASIGGSLKWMAVGVVALLKAIVWGWAPEVEIHRPGSTLSIAPMSTPTPIARTAAGSLNDDSDVQTIIVNGAAASATGTAADWWEEDTGRGRKADELDVDGEWGGVMTEEDRERERREVREREAAGRRRKVSRDGYVYEVEVDGDSGW